MNNNLPWTEKYRPDKLSDIIDEGNKVSIIRGLINKDEIPNMLFYGPPGTGKTSLILACVKEYYGNNYRKYVKELNASDDRGIDTVRNTIPEFVKTSTNKIKIVILDEADALTNDAQGALRRTIEQYCMYCRFCLICNNIYKIIIGLRSRCVTIRFGKLPYCNLIEKLNKIIEIENVRIDDKAKEYLSLECSDFRQILNMLQLIHTLKTNLQGPEYQPIMENDICDYLSIPTKSMFNEIIKNLTTKTIKFNSEMLLRHHNSNMYTIVELVKMLVNWIAHNPKLTTNQKKTVIKELAELDNRLKNSMGESDIQIYQLATIFTGLKIEL